MIDSSKGILTKLKYGIEPLVRKKYLMVSKITPSLQMGRFFMSHILIPILIHHHRLQNLQVHKHHPDTKTRITTTPPPPTTDVTPTPPPKESQVKQPPPPTESPGTQTPPP